MRARALSMVVLQFVFFSFVIMAIDDCVNQGALSSCRARSNNTSRTLERLQRFERMVPFSSLREMYIGQVKQRLDSDEIEAAREISLAGVTAGVFKDAWQRPEVFLEGVAGPSLDTAPSHSVVASLVKHHIEIVTELREFLMHDALLPVPEALVSSGEWHHVVLFYSNGTGWTEAAESFPTVKSIVSTAEQSVPPTGVISISRLMPGTHVKAHCGPSNIRTRIHLGLQVPSNVSMIRVAGTVQRWEQGKAFSFDDSYEHEVWHRGAADSLPRVVLIIDQWHGNLAQDTKARASTLLKELGY